MHSSLKSLLVGFIGLVALLGGVSASTLPPLHSVLKVVSYQDQELIADNYTKYAHGSAIALSNYHILTNAHVILDDEYNPMSHIAVCLTDDAFEVPDCPTTASIVTYDIDKDIAILELHGQIDVQPVTFSEDNLTLGETVQVLGYPSNGGDTITLTQGKVAGKDSGHYKIDANLDGGNSGGGVFNSDGECIGMPVSVMMGYTTLGYMIPAEDIRTFYDEHVGDEPLFQRDESFDTYITNQHLTQSEKRVENPFFTYKFFDIYGFEPVDQVILPGLDTYKYIFASHDKKTQISISASPYSQADDDPGTNIETLLDEMKVARDQVSYVQDKEFMGRKRDILYMDGYRGIEIPDTTLMLVHQSESMMYVYTITSQSAQSTHFINALRAMIVGRSIYDIDSDVDVHQLGELLLPSSLSIANPESNGKGLTVSLSYGDKIEGSADYDFKPELMINPASYEDSFDTNDRCIWMDESENECQSTWIQNKNDIRLHLTSFVQPEYDEGARVYIATIIDQYQDSYVQYNLWIETDDSVAHNQRVHDFINKIDAVGAIEWIFDSEPKRSTQRQ